MKAAIERRLRTKRQFRVHAERNNMLVAREEELSLELNQEAKWGEVRQHYAITSIQCRYRGVLGRRKADKIRIRYYGAICIQAHFRGLLGRQGMERERARQRRVLRSAYGMDMLLKRSKVTATIQVWEERFDPYTNEFFYYNTKTNDSQWEPQKLFKTRLFCDWPGCSLRYKNTHGLHEHQRTAHLWKCTACCCSNVGLVFPYCAMCQYRQRDDDRDAANEVQQPASPSVSPEKPDKENQNEVVKDNFENAKNVQSSLSSQFEPSPSPISLNIKGANNIVESEDSSRSDNSFAQQHRDDDSTSNDIYNFANLSPDATWITDCLQNDNRVYAKAKFTSGSLYVGEWKTVKNRKERVFDGFGEYYYANGDKYVGNWQQAERHGDGTLNQPIKSPRY